MDRILVTYVTMAGSTADVARVVAGQLEQCGLETDVLPIAAVKSLEGYSGVVVGAPMIMGWHRDAAHFLRRHRKALQLIPLAAFATMMRLTRTETTTLDGVPLTIDAELPEPPAVEGKLSLKERYATVQNYARPILGAIRPAKPASVAFFGGRMEYGRLPRWAVIFAMVIIQAPAGNRLNWPAIREWAASLPQAFQHTR